jgi:hypothetical protein
MVVAFSYMHSAEYTYIGHEIFSAFHYWTESTEGYDDVSFTLHSKTL